MRLSFFSSLIVDRAEFYRMKFFKQRCDRGEHFAEVRSCFNEATYVVFFSVSSDNAAFYEMRNWCPKQTKGVA